MDYNKHIEELKQEYQSEKENFQKYYEQLKKQSVKTIISKGCMFNVLPFENELSGRKLSGKPIPEIINHNECYVYHFDSQDRIVLIENVSAFLKQIYYYTMYFYADNEIKSMHWQPDRLINMQRYYLKNGLIQAGIFVYQDSKIYTRYEYFYENGILKKIQMNHVSGNNESLRDFIFTYDANGKLQLIQTVYDTGGSENCYSTLKINYKKLEERITTEICDALDKFIKENADTAVYVMALDCYTGHDYLSLDMNTNQWLDDAFGQKKPKELLEIKYNSPADWQYCELVSINDLVNRPLDEKEELKVLQTITKSFLQIINSNAFKTLKRTNDFVCILFNHNVNLLDDYPSIKKIVKDCPFFKSYNELAASKMLK